jgi:hypothetical protein
MNKFLKELQEKSKKLVEIAESENALAEGKKLLKGLNEKKLLKNVNKGMSEFYSSPGFIALKALIKHDNDILDTNQPISKYNELHFFDLYLEIKTQELLFNKYAEIIFVYEDEVSRYKEISNSVNMLNNKILTYIKTRGLTAQYNMQMAKIQKDIADYADIISLIK